MSGKSTPKLMSENPADSCSEACIASIPVRIQSFSAPCL